MALGKAESACVIWRWTEFLLKLPVVVYNRRSKDDVLTDALQMRSLLEVAAKEEFEQVKNKVVIQ